MAVMLTTVDNPFNPFTQYDEWYAYDTRLGHHSTALLSRVAIVSNNTSEADYDLAITQAIDEICRINASGVHRKVYDTDRLDSETV